MMIVILGAFALIALIDLRPLLAKKKWHAVAAFLTIFVLALVIGILTSMDIRVPSVSKLWGDLFELIGVIYPD